MARNQRPSQRGIFGILKPAEPMLFSFLPNSAQEWPSDDDADSDYDPDSQPALEDGDDDEGARPESSSKSQNQRKKTTCKKTKRKKTSSSKRKDEKNPNPEKRKSTRRQEEVTSPRPKHHHRDSAEPTLDNRSPAAETKSKESRGNGPSSSEADLQRPVPEGHQLWGQRLPMVALQNVFQHVVGTDGAIPFLCRACKVCRLWREAASHSLLWQHLDLANGRIKCTDATLEWLAGHRLSLLKSINLGGWKKLTDTGLKALIEHSSQHLGSIGLSNCIKLTAESLSALVHGCPSLHSLDLSNSNADVISVASMVNALQALGGRLRSLNLAGNKLKGAPAILKALMTHCNNLLTLDISNCKFTSDFLMLHVEELQGGCPRLEVLRLAGCMVRASQASGKVQAASTGFPELQELSLAVNNDNVANGGIAIDDNMLLRLLVKSHKLKLLDLRGCTHISAAGIQSLPVYDLEHLFISQCSVSRYEGIEAIIQKWRHSLIELDLSWNVFPAMSLDIAMKKLASVPGQSVLRDINLAGTSITAERVRSILEGCPSLVSLHLASCRGLPRGMKRSYHGTCLAQLKQDLKAAPASSLEYVD